MLFNHLAFTLRAEIKSDKTFRKIIIRDIFSENFINKTVIHYSTIKDLFQIALDGAVKDVRAAFNVSTGGTEGVRGRERG